MKGIYRTSADWVSRKFVLSCYEGLPFSPSSSLLFGCTASRCSIYRGLGVDPRALELLAYVM